MTCCFTSLPSFAGTLCMHVGAHWASSVHFVLLTTTWLLPQRIVASSTLWRHVQLNSAARCVWAHADVHRVRWCAFASTAFLDLCPNCPTLIQCPFAVSLVGCCKCLILKIDNARRIAVLNCSFALRLLQLLWRSYLRRHETGHFMWACMSS